MEIIMNYTQKLILGKTEAILITLSDIPNTSLSHNKLVLLTKY